MTTLLLPNSELVARAWISQVTGLPASAVGATLPRAVTSWASTGFVTVLGTGGSPDLYLPVARPVLSVSCWAATVDASGNVSNKPPWGRANQLAEQIRAASYRAATDPTSRYLAMPVPGYAHAHVQAAYLTGEPRRMPGDQAGYARYQCDLALSWVAEGS